MILTPLYLKVLRLSQWVTDNIFRYRSFLYWDHNSLQFARESRKKHVWYWIFMNFGVYGMFGLPTLILFLLGAKSYPESTSTVEVFVAMWLLCLGFAVFCGALTYLKWGLSMIEGLNKTFEFEYRVRKKYVGKPKVKVGESLKFQSIRLPSGEIDFLGIIGGLLVVGFSIIPPFLPWIMMLLELDIPFLFFREVVKTFDLPGKILFYTCRVILDILAVTEACSCLRNITLSSLPFIGAVQSCHRFLMSQPLDDTTLGELRQLKILFTSMRDGSAFLFSTCLACIYIILLSSITLVAVTNMPWHFYLLVSLIGSITMFIIIIVLALVVSVDLLGSELHRQWKLPSSKLDRLPEKSRLLHKILNSIQPVRFQYGSLGYFKRTTRIDFFESLATSTLNCIIAFR